MAEPTAKPEPSSAKPKKYVYAGIGFAVAAAIAGIVLFLYQPNIQVVDQSVSAFKNPQIETVFSLGRVSGGTSYDYTPSKAGSYELIFSNEMSIVSTKTVYLNADNSVSGSQVFSIPAGTSKVIPVESNIGDHIKGSFSIQGGSGNEVDFYIQHQFCNQRATITYGLVNSGISDGTADVSILSDGSIISSNAHFVKQGERIERTQSFDIDDCNKHNFTVKVAGQRR